MTTRIPEPGDQLILADYCDWPDATLTVVSVRPVKLRQPRPDGTSHTHLIRTTSDHPGPRWSSYDREWWAWFVAERMRRIPGPAAPEPPITAYSQLDIFDLLEAHA